MYIWDVSPGEELNRVGVDTQCLLSDRDRLTRATGDPRRIKDQDTFPLIFYPR